MLRFSCLLLLPVLLSAQAAWAGPAHVWWPGWTFTSSEELSQDAKYLRPSGAPFYPLPLALDGDRSTAWVWSSTSRERDASVWKSRQGLELQPDRAIELDALRLMSGHNASPARFKRNHRVRAVRVTLATPRGKIVRSFRLPDRMGWHSLPLGRHKATSIKLEFTDVRPGSGPQSDLCISELEVMKGGRPIDLRMPRAVMFNDGLEGCGSSLLISRQGQMLAGIATDVGCKDSWSPSGRYVSGVAGPEGRLWVADSWRGRVLPRAQALKLAAPDARWLTARLAEAPKSPL